MLIATESDDGLELAFEYATELFERATIERLIASLRDACCADIIRRPASRLADARAARRRTSRAVLAELNATEHDAAAGESVLELFDDWVSADAGRARVVFRDQTWTLRRGRSPRERDRDVAARARRRPRRLVPIVLDPCAENLPAVLGVLKSGAAFLPIDVRRIRSAASSDPRRQRSASAADARRARRRLAISRAAPRCRDARRARPPRRSTCALARRVRDLHVGLDGETEGRRDRARQPAQLHGLVRRTTTRSQPGEALSKYAGPSFDTSISELFPACTPAATLVIVPAELRLDAAELSAYFETQQVKVAFLPTQFGEQFLRTTGHALAARSVALAGEKMRSYRPAAGRS